MDAIVCEDTRVIGKLLSLLGLPKKELLSLHGHSDGGKLAMILRRLENNAHLALVSDAGTPGISDPGTILVAKTREARLPIEVIPGPSAVIAALSASGLPTHQFQFLGFLPIKKGKKKALMSIAQSDMTTVIYESPHRIERTLRELSEFLAHEPSRRVVIARELTKLHEEVLTFKVSELPSAKITVKGEFTLVIEGTKGEREENEGESEQES